LNSLIKTVLYSDVFRYYFGASIYKLNEKKSKRNDKLYIKGDEMKLEYIF